MSPEELKLEYEIWRSFTTNRTPAFFPGFLEVLRDFRAAGGKVAVISHSERDVIEAHYARAGVPAAAPDLVFGWVEDALRRNRLSLGEPEKWKQKQKGRKQAGAGILFHRPPFQFFCA